MCRCRFSPIPMTVELIGVECAGYGGPDSSEFSQDRHHRVSGQHGDLAGQQCGGWNWHSEQPQGNLCEFHRSRIQRDHDFVFFRSPQWKNNIIISIRWGWLGLLGVYRQRYSWESFAHDLLWIGRNAPVNGWFLLSLVYIHAIVSIFGSFWNSLQAIRIYLI